MVLTTLVATVFKLVTILALKFISGLLMIKVQMFVFLNMVVDSRFLIDAQWEFLKVFIDNS